MTTTRPRTIAALDVAAADVEAEARRMALLEAYRHQPEPLEGEFAALACTHPSACAHDEDYPGWADHVAKVEAQNALYREVAAWNRAHPIGTAVTAYPGARPEVFSKARRIDTTTRSEAQVLSGHTVVVWVDGHEACIALTHIDIRPGGTP